MRAVMTIEALRHRRLRPAWRRGAGAFALLATACGDVSEAPPADGGPERPDLVLVTVDTLRPDRLACYGGTPGVGARLCGLADGGFRYVWAFATAPATAPSVASILTSRYPSRHGVTEFAASRLADELVTVGEALRDAGYDTAAFVGNPVLDPGRNLGQGFERYDARMTRGERNRPGLTERDARALTDAALAWLAGARAPFFLWVHYQDPHGPYDPPDAPPRPRDEGPGPALPVLADHSGRGGIPAYQALPGVVRAGSYAAFYEDEIRYLDRHLARLLDALRATGRPTGILLTADHGEAFGEDGYYFAHGHSLALDQIRVPLLWRPPGGAAPRSLRAVVSTVSVAPTLLAAAGIAAPASFVGGPLPTDDATRSAQPVFAEHRLRAALLTGAVYYARDREPLTRPVPDRISGGTLESLPARTAVLPRDGAKPRYAPVPDGEDGAALERLLAAFVAASAPGETQAASGPVPPDLRERLRALGYLD